MEDDAWYGWFWGFHTSRCWNLPKKCAQWICAIYLAPGSNDGCSLERQEQPNGLPLPV
jgi:hypothetical protein